MVAEEQYRPVNPSQPLARVRFTGKAPFTSKPTSRRALQISVSLNQSFWTQFASRLSNLMRIGPCIILIFE